MPLSLWHTNQTTQTIMKKHLLVAFLAGLFVLFSCNKATEESSTKASQINPDCSETMESVAAMPDSVFDGRTHVTLNRDFLQSVKKDQEALRSLKKPYADDLANMMSGYEDLISKYGYELKTREAVSAYYSLVAQENAAESMFTMEELEYLSNL